MMAADTAISTQINGIRYRVSDWEDYGKIFEHNGALIFCSGETERCSRLSAYIRGMNPLNLLDVQAYAQKLFEHNTADDSTGILVCWEDGNMVGMLSAQDFRLVPIPWNRDRPDFFTIGFRQEEAHNVFWEHFANEEPGQMLGLRCIARSFYDLQCEEVGGKVHIYSRVTPDEPLCDVWLTLEEKDIIRKITKKSAKDSFHFPTKYVPAHGIIKAKDFMLPSGDSMVSVLNNKGQICGDHIDARGLSIVDDYGRDVLQIDKTGIHWSQEYSPFKFQYAISQAGPWHDTPNANDEYRRESCDGGRTWSAGIKYIAKDGTNGRPGSDASVTFDNIKSALQKASGVSSAYLTMDELGAPEIYGGKIYGGQIVGGSILGGAFYNDSGNARLELVDPLSGGSWGGLTLYGGHDGDRKLFEVYDSDMDSVSLSGGGAHFMTVKNEYSDGAAVEAKGSWDFSNAKVSGMTAVFS